MAILSLLFIVFVFILFLVSNTLGAVQLLHTLHVLETLLELGVFMQGDKVDRPLRLFEDLEELVHVVDLQA